MYKYLPTDKCTLKNLLTETYNPSINPKIQHGIDVYHSIQKLIINSTTGIINFNNKLHPKTDFFEWLTEKASRCTWLLELGFITLQYDKIITTNSAIKDITTHNIFTFAKNIVAYKLVDSNFGVHNTMGKIFHTHEFPLSLDKVSTTPSEFKVYSFFHEAEASIPKPAFVPYDGPLPWETS